MDFGLHGKAETSRNAMYDVLSWRKVPRWSMIANR
jgi:hypothetical protein